MDKKVGTFGDAAFFSFGRDKIISSVYGGMLITKNSDLAEKIDAEYKKIPFPSHFWVFQQLMHPIVFALSLPLYGIGVGKFIILFMQKLHFLSKAVTATERIGGKPEYFPKRLPEALANLALSQFKRLEKFNAHRREIANYYKENLLNTLTRSLSLGVRAPPLGAVASPARYHSGFARHNRADSVAKYEIR
jgi:hypothetical protein